MQYPNLGGKIVQVTRGEFVSKAGEGKTCAFHLKYCLVAGIDGAKQKAADSEELTHLHSCGAIKVRAQNTVIISVPLLAFALSRTAGKSHLVHCLQELTSGDSFKAGLATPVLALPPSIAQVQQEVHQVQQGLPMNLPDCTIDLDTFPKHYRLHSKYQGSQPLQSDMSEFKKWLFAPIQMNRNGGKSSARTVENIERNVFLFLGYCQWQHELEEFSLSLFLDTDKYSGYIAFQMAKQNSKVNISQQLSNARKVLAFLRRSASAAVSSSISAVEVWLLNLSKQIARLLPEKKLDVGDLEEEGAWLSASEVVVMMEKLRTMALEDVAKCEGELGLFVARMLHDAALGNCMFGWIPPPRLSCLRLLQVPNHKGCLHVDCMGSVNHKNCGGNRLERKGGDLLMILPHHKNQVRWTNAEIKFKLPKELQSLLELYLEKGHSVISPASPYVFSDQKGKAMQSASQISHWWETLLKKMGSPAIFPPNRSAFLDECTVSKN